MKILKNISSINFGMLVVLALFVPVFVFQGSFGPYLASKETLFIGLISVLVVLFGVKVVMEKKLTAYMSVLHNPVKFLLAAVFLSAVFGEKSNWFFGRNDYFVLSILTLISFALLTFFVVQNTINEFRRETLIGVLSLSGAIASLVYLGKVLFGFEALKFIQPGIWNTVDSANTNFGVFIGVILLLSVAEALRIGTDPKWRAVHYISTILGLVTLITLGFKYVLGLVVFGLLIQLFVSLKFKNSFRKWSAAVLGVLAAILLVVFVTGAFKTKYPIPVEAALSMNQSWSVVSDSLVSGVQRFLFGGGPGSFGILFSEFRDPSFNLSSATANLRFNYPGNTIFSIAGENGVISLLAFFAVVLSVVMGAYSTLRESSGEVLEVQMENGFVDVNELKTENAETASALMFSVAWLTLTVGMGLFFYSFTLWFLWWLLLGLCIIGFAFANPKMIRVVTVELENILSQKYATNLGLSIVGLIFILVNVFNLRIFLADRWFLEAFAAQDFSTAESLIKKAIKYRPGFDSYHSALSRVYFNDAAEKTKAQNPDLKVISETLSNSVIEARKATDLSPKKAEYWEKLADIYERSAALVPEAADYAVKGVQKARELDPNNAFLAVRLAKLYEGQGKNDLALKEYESAIGLKSDFWPVYTLLSNLYEKSNDQNKAILTFESVLKAMPSDIEARYNYGRLYYNRNKAGDRDYAEKIWQSILNENPNYSNALYSLGLVNELRGDRRKALEYYYKVRQLNPDNKDIKAKIAKLER